MPVWIQMNLSKLSARFNILKRKLAPYRWLVFWGSVVAAVAAAGIVIVKVIFPLASAAGNYLFKPLSTISILKDPAGALKSNDGRTNILILGRGGASHEAPDLTDTMIVLSIRLKDKQVSSVSIPRDIWINSMKAKINSAYYYGEKKQPGGGLILVRDAVFQVTDLPIHYAVLVDFDGFKKAIDLVGGVEVEVKRRFTDEKYPIENSDPSGFGRTSEFSSKENTGPSEKQIYQTVSFEAGWQHMDGDTALRFSRSRYSADPEEGSDFARSKRQQQILVSLALKIKQKETALNAERVKQLRRIFDDYTETDLGEDEMLALGRIGIGINLQGIQQVSLDEGTKEEPGLLINPPTSKYGQWVLEPRAGDWEEVHKYINSQLL
ncbi:LCP family protein [Candidatus Collierbacteria bacterium]|nr:LCP family protein [Candidatus Collierbacteria bacterium]